MPPHEDGPVDEGDDAHVGAATGADERPGEEQTGDERGLYILAVTMKERCAASQAGFPEWGVLLWLAAVLAAALWVLRPADDYVPPSGWQHWPQTGPVLAVADDGHRLLVAGRNGLFELDPDVDKAVALASPGFQIPGLVHALARDPAGHLWVGHQAGVAIRDGDRWIHVDRFSDRPLIDVRAIAFEHNGIAWIGGNGGVWRVRWSVHGIASASDLSAEPVLTGVDTLSMLIDRDGGVWIGTRAGLHQRRSDDTEGWRLWATPDGLPNLQVAALMQDHSGRIWVGTGFHDRGGTILLERQSGVWRIAATLDPASLAAPKTRSLFQTDTGDIWIGSETDGLSVLGPDLRPKAIIEGNRLPNPEVTVIRAARNGGLWLGTLNGLIHVDDDAVGRLIH
ncbi:MAG: hypothetical protein EOM91_18940 [Sphingobacteriia bacterium]|nr:hypothetical protein [Sphingobacteriia bacterium]